MTDPANGRTRRPSRPHVSGTQLVASVLAAVTATVAASYLGVAGTVIGAAVASMLTVLGNAIFGHSLQRGTERWMPPRAPAPLPESGEPSADAIPIPSRRGSSVRVMAAAAVGVFVGVVAVVTLVEVVAGKPLSYLLEGKHGSGTSLFGDQSAPKRKVTPVPTVTVTASVVVVTPTVTLTGSAVTETATPTVTITPTPTPTPDTSPPSASPSPTLPSSSTP